MTKLATQQPSLAISCPSPSIPAPAPRLIVLVPSLEADLSAITRRVWDLASTLGAHIKFISLCDDSTKESTLRRRLVTMSAIVNYDTVSAETEVINGRDWLAAVRSRQQPGDMVVCFQEQRAGLLQRPLSQILRSDLDLPVYILSGLYPQQASHLSGSTRAGAWIGFLVIIIGFFVVQVRIYQFANGWVTLLEMLSTAIEFWLLWVCNNLFR
jgi:hypothetical protein